MRLRREAPLPVDDIDDGVVRARAVCARLNIAHYAIDLTNEFERQVVDHLVAEYVRGRTPNPSLRFNQLFKFGALLAQARSLGASHLATGHYARVERRADGYHLLAADAAKDQSYVLYALQQEQLAALVLPMGDLAKKRVRDIAPKQAVVLYDGQEVRGGGIIVEARHAD